MNERLMALGASFDWISPVVALIRDLLHGPRHGFEIGAGSPLSGLQIEQLLRDNGIRTWGLMAVDDSVLLTVPKQQARWAQYILTRNGVPIASGANADWPNRRRVAGSGSTAGGPLAALDGWLDHIGDRLLP